jgi:phosphoribosylamine--glycine ligase
MKVLVVGGGGREHALVWKIKQSSLVEEIFCAPGNGGTEEIAQNIDIKAGNIGELIRFAKNEKIGLTVVGPEGPLVNGITDSFQSEGLMVFGPSKNAAMIEGSKIYSKMLMERISIPQASFEKFHNVERAIDYLNKQKFPLVIKASGLAAGKGAIIAENIDEAKVTVLDIMVDRRFGKAGESIVIEEYLSGEEVSLLVLTDGETALPFVSSQDHKKIFDDDKGPNTGGMGAYAPAPLLDMKKAEILLEGIIHPVLEELKREGARYRGVLYAGLIFTEGGPKVLEFNCRFGDPETQAILPLLRSDLVEVVLNTIHGELKNSSFEWADSSAVCVVLASGGYPGSYEKGKEIEGLDSLKQRNDIVVFHAGTKKEGGKMLTNGGRVLGVTGIGSSLEDAITKTYSAINEISFESMHFRKDIGKKGLRKE